MRSYLKIGMLAVVALEMSACGFGPHSSEDVLSPTAQIPGTNSSASAVAPHDGNACNSVALIRLAVEAEYSGEAEKAQLLEEAALHRMNTNLCEAPAMWAFLQETSAAKSDNVLRSLERLLGFQREIDAALAHCSNVTDFEQAWTVRIAVQEEIAEARTKVKSALIKELTTLNSLCSGKGFRECLDILKDAMSGSLPQDQDKDPLSSLLLISLGESETPESEKLTATSLHSGIQPYSQILDLTKLILDRGRSELDALKSRIDTEVASDLTSELIEPAATGMGKYQTILEDLTALGASLEDAGLAILLTYTNSEDTSRSMLELVSESTALAYRASDSQTLRYNLWAMQQIYVSETASSWPQRLGSIEMRLLHPNVSALYSMTYDDLIRRETNSTARTSVVHQVLNKEKVTLDQF